MYKISTRVKSNQTCLWGNLEPCLELCILLIPGKLPDKNFMSFFLGFIDGDGYFDIGEQKQYNKLTKAPAKSTIRLRLASNVHLLKRDKPLFEHFIAVLGVGKLSLMSRTLGGPQIRIIFSKKDLVEVIIPLIKHYNLQFLTFQRVNQFNLINYILDNSIIHWENVKFKETPFTSLTVESLLNLDYFKDWLIGFTVAEGSFGVKTSGSAFYQLKQKGEKNLNLLKAACLLITGRPSYAMKADKVGCYQLSLTSKLDIKKTINFFSSSNHHPLCGYKLFQYLEWLNFGLFFLIKKKRKEKSTRYKIIEDENNSRK